ncbi:MAG: sugar ABC transporter substrate-binding protein [Thermomicrobiales bacterium]
MTVNRREFLKKAGTAGAGLAAAGAAAKISAPAVVRAQDTVKLSVWKAPHTTDEQVFFDEQLAKFTEANPGIEVEYRVTPWATWQETYTAAFASDEPPDVSYVVDSFFPKYSDAGALVDLATLEGADLAAWQALYEPSIWDRGTRNGGTFGLPFLTGGSSFVWNKKLFAEAGLDPETPPATWDEVVEWAKLLTKSDGSQWGYSVFDNTTGEALNFYPIPMVNYGGNLANDDNTEWLANTPEHIKGLQLQVDTILVDKTAPPIGQFVGIDIFTQFLMGKIGMQLTLSQFILPLLGDYPDLDFGVSVPPSGPANNLSLGGVGYWMMAEKSKHKAEAWALMEFLASAEVMTGYCQLSNIFQTRLDVNPWEGQPKTQEFAATQKNYMVLPSMPFDYWTILNPEAEAAFSGQKSAEDALNTAAQIINERLAQG